MHCIFRNGTDKFTVKVGESGNGSEHHVIGIHVHPDFEHNTSRSDVALLMLEKPLVFSKYVSFPIAIVDFFLSLYIFENVGIVNQYASHFPFHF